MFSIHPNKISAKESRLAQSDRVKKSITYLIEECVNKIEFSGDSAQASLSKLREIERIPPEIHYYHHSLQAAMRRQSINDANIELAKLINAIVNTYAQSNWINISSIGGTDWERFIVNEAIKLTEVDCRKLVEINPISESELNVSKDIVISSLCTIARNDPEMFDEIQEQVRIIKLFNGKVTMGLTDVRMLGAMFIRLPRTNINPELYFLEHIIHEASHIHLNCLMAIDPCILNSPEERFVSPLRSDLRPMIGVFHATFVSARVARTIIKLYQATNNDNLIHTLAETLDEIIRGISEIEAHAILSLAGKKIIESIKEILDSGKALPIWRDYDFSNQRTHRFGSGSTKINDIRRLVA